MSKWSRAWWFMVGVWQVVILAGIAVGGISIMLFTWLVFATAMLGIVHMFGALDGP